MFAVNDPAKGGSFYIQSKIYRSNEVLEKEVLGINDDAPTSEAGDKSSTEVAPTADRATEEANQHDSKAKNRRSD